MGFRLGSKVATHILTSLAPPDTFYVRMLAIHISPHSSSRKFLGSPKLTKSGLVFSQKATFLNLVNTSEDEHRMSLDGL